MRVDTVDTHNY